MAATAFDHYPVIAPVSRPVLVKAENLIAAAAVFASLALVTLRAPLRRSMLERYGHVLLPYALIAASSLASAVLIYPRTHYLAIPAVLAMLTAALAATVLIARPNGPSPGGSGPLAALICLAAVPKPFALPSDYVVAGSPFKARITDRAGR